MSTRNIYDKFRRIFESLEKNKKTISQHDKILLILIEELSELKSMFDVLKTENNMININTVSQAPLTPIPAVRPPTSKSLKKKPKKNTKQKKNKFSDARIYSFCKRIQRKTHIR